MNRIQWLTVPGRLGDPMYVLSQRPRNVNEKCGKNCNKTLKKYTGAEKYKSGKCDTIKP